MENVTLALAVLLAAGVLAAKAGQLLKLPSVTGYILAGLLLGPSGFGIVTMESVGHKLHHFTQIALMLIAFGIGEQIEVKRLRQSARSIGVIGFCEAIGALVFVASVSFFVARLCTLDCVDWGTDDYLVLALLLGAVSVATAPATTLHVMRELKAKGPLTSTLMAVVAIDNGLAIILFGLAMSLAGQISTAGSGSLPGAVFGSVLEISLSLSAGLLTGLVISFVLHHLKRQDEMLTAGLALLLLCGEGCRLFHLSPLLAGMAAGFTVINRVTRDVRLFRALNAFEPPIYVLFFTLAGSHLDLASLGNAGWLGLVYYFFRIIGKYCGAYTGAFFSGAPAMVRNYLGVALMPQAGVAIGLIFLISSDENLAAFSAIITPVVLAGVVLSELSGPVCARLAVIRAGESGETVEQDLQPNGRAGKRENNSVKSPEAFSLVPWTWEKLVSHPIPDGVVAFGAKQSAKVKGLARMATILAHHYNAVPLSVRVVQPSSRGYILNGAMDSLFSGERDEVEKLGYELQTELVPDKDIASGLVAAVEYNDAKAVVLGYPIEGTFQSFQEILEKVANNVACPVVLVRFYGELHTERILVPVRSLEELGDVGPIVHALSRVGDHQLTILYLLPADEPDERVEFKKHQLADWVKRLKITAQITFQIDKTEARQETILKESEKHDLVVMGTSKKNVLKKLFFGSLVETVSRRIRKPLLIVYRPANEALLADRQLR
jgi:Kef-type K+ transport system membrane component KefB/nucleotide-binding universal stress UspA family protein